MNEYDTDRTNTAGGSDRDLLRPDSPVADVLKAAAAKAEAFKTAAARAEQQAEPYRRETDWLEDPAEQGYAGINAAAEAAADPAGRADAAAAEAEASRSDAAAAPGTAAEVISETAAAPGTAAGVISEPAAKPADAAGSAASEPSGIRGSGFIMRDADADADANHRNSDSPSSERSAAVDTEAHGTAGRSGFGAHVSGTADNAGRFDTGTAADTADNAGRFDTGTAAGTADNAGRFDTGTAAGTADNAGRFDTGAAADTASGPNEAGRPGMPRMEGARPRFENPSFDPGQTGHYTDPRNHFRTGESASWTNGEVHRSRRQVKDSIQKQAQKQQKAPARPVMLTRRALGLLIAGCLCLSCLTGIGGAALATTLAQQHQNTAQTTAATAAADSSNLASNAGYTLESATGSKMTIKEITAATKSSVVEIRTESVASDTWMQQYVTEGAGSGVIISEDGYIMTNNHVIDGAGKIKVTTADEKEYEATLIGTDETNDVAVLKINASGLTPATYGNSDSLEVGDMAVAIGNPLGELGGTVTAGIISATDRELAIDGKTMHLLQTDSSINPGNSGGGLFNGDGQLIGLVVAKSSGSDVEGLGFAIPINTAANVAQQLIDKGYVSGQPSTGMTYQNGTSSTGGSNDPFSSFDSFFGGNTSTGVYIYSVNGENAKKAGFQPGDQVYAVDGEEITSFDDLSTIITSHKVGDKVKFTIIRDGVQKNIKLELEEKTASAQNSSGSQNSQNGQNEQSQNGQAGPGSSQQGQTPDQNSQNNGQNNPNGQNGQNGQNNGSSQNQGGWQDWFSMFF